MSNERNITINTPSFLALLSILIITLKLCGVIGLSWWLVLLPLYAPIAVILGLLALYLLFVWIFG